MSTAYSEPQSRRRDPEGRRRAIINAAAQIVAEQGATALTHRAVAARANVSLGSTTRYFASIDELYQAALRCLSDENEESLGHIEAELAAHNDDLAELFASLAHSWLLDSHQVRASVALTTAATSDAGLRELAVRWTDRLVNILAGYVGAERAAALEIYLNGATMHAAVHDVPISEETIVSVIRAILAMPDSESN